MNTRALSLSLAVSAALLAPPALAEQFGPLEVVGFAKDEFSFCDNCSSGIVNPSAYDPRGVLSPPDPMLNQGGESESTSANLGLVMLTLRLRHEFDNAVSIEAGTSGRMRNNGPDIYDNWMTDLYAGVSHPTYGSLQVGKMATRTWTRADSFAYPLGLSTSWAESGAGYGVVPEALRYATREFEIPTGKIRFEATMGRARERVPLNPSSTVIPPPSPKMLEVFIQYSNSKNLIEAMFQGTSGGRQSSFSKGAFYGAQGDTNGPTGSPGYEKPTQNVSIIEGTYWHSPTWKVSYGIKRSEWSGQQQQCDYGPVSPIASDCFFDQPGFNYASDLRMHHAIEWDAMLGVGYTRGLWVYTLGGVRMNKAYVKTPTEWGQSNTATFVNFGVYRKLPEVYKNLEIYGGLGRVMFGRQGPAPLSMPSNTAFGGVDPRISESGNSATIGVNLTF
ncbi:MAG: hypothetical protein IT483_15215 [Gammaproteobacteria bacterium]|nr:hypothetical protein [Gammaproteobacteria bacterium]